MSNLMESLKKVCWLGVPTVALFAVVFIAFANETLSDEEPVDSAFVPQRVILTLSEDPETSMSVVWRTDKQPREVFGEVLAASHDPQSLELGERIEATSERLVLDSSSTIHYHTVHFKNLKPGVVYSYRVGSGRAKSEWNQFTTARSEPDPFTFIYLGDAQNDVLSRWSRTLRTAIMDAPNVSFILYAGDLINHPNDDREWGDWFTATGWVNRVIPTLATPGNHEYLHAKTIKKRLFGIQDARLFGILETPIRVSGKRSERAGGDGLLCRLPRGSIHLFEFE